jgi:hypothetical protein
VLSSTILTNTWGACQPYCLICTERAVWVPLAMAEGGLRGGEGLFSLGSGRLPLRMLGGQATLSLLNSLTDAALLQERASTAAPGVANED